MEGTGENEVRKWMGKARDGDEMCGFIIPRDARPYVYPPRQMGMTSMREGTAQSTKMPRGFCRMARRKGDEKQSEMRGMPRGGERNNETSRLALETGEKKSETCV